jgi:hypothetical protein
VREQVEALEDHPDLCPLACDVALAVLDEPVAAVPVADQLAVDLDPAGVDLLEVVDAPEERRLAGARRADDADVTSSEMPFSTSSLPKRLRTSSACITTSLIATWAPRVPTR